MKIYYNKVHVETMEDFILARDNDYFLRLVGVNYFKDEQGIIHVEPVHKPALTIERRAGQIMIDIYREDEVLRFLFQRRSPRIMFGRYNLSMEENE